MFCRCRKRRGLKKGPVLALQLSYSGSEGFKVVGQSVDSISHHAGGRLLIEPSNVPIGVWKYVIGGYQVMKKWLSYREQSLLGRPLMNSELHEVQEMARRIAAILLLQPSLDANYWVCKENSYMWPSGQLPHI